MPRDARRNNAHQDVMARTYGVDDGWFPKKQEIFLDFSTRVVDWPPCPK
jgi:hypothetical protein